MVALTGIPQTFEGVVRMLDRCSSWNDGCDECRDTHECVRVFDRLCDFKPYIKGYKSKCYRFGKWFSEINYSQG